MFTLIAIVLIVAALAAWRVELFRLGLGKPEPRHRMPGSRRPWEHTE